MAEEDPWGFDDGDVDFTAETPAADAPAADAGSLRSAGGAGGAAVPEGRPVMDEQQDESHYRKPLTLNKHWVRCVHLSIAVSGQVDALNINVSCFLCFSFHFDAHSQAEVSAV